MNVNKALLSDKVESFEELADRLTRAYGGIVGGAMLTRALGYPSQGAFRQAFARRRVPVPVFTIEGRRGRFAQVADIARWLWLQRSTSTSQKSIDQPERRLHPCPPS